jgi:hypothetical protein
MKAGRRQHIGVARSPERREHVELARLQSGGPLFYYPGSRPQFGVIAGTKCAQPNVESGKVISEPKSQPTAHCIGIITATPDIPIVTDKGAPTIVPANRDSGMDRKNSEYQVGR